MKRLIPTLISLFILSAIVFLPNILLAQATITVTNTNDSGAGSFRQAIADAAGGDIIEFAAGISGSTITLTTEEFADLAAITFQKSLTIDGDINGDGTADITISGGGTVGGIALFNNTSADLTVRNLNFDNFEQGSSGGVIYTVSANSVTIENVTISNFSSAAPNGIAAINIDETDATIDRVTIHGTDLTSSSQQSLGYGIHIEESSGSSTATISNTLLYENNFTALSGAQTAGGLISANAANGTLIVNIKNLTMVDNTVDASASSNGHVGAGLLGITTDGSLTVNLSNSILSNTALGSESTLPSIVSVTDDISIVESGSGSVSINQTTNITGTFSGFNDAASDDYTLSSGSTSAVDQGTDSEIIGTEDRAGETRNVDYSSITNNGSNTVDIGAFELQQSITIPTVTTTAETGVGATNATLGGNVTADGGAAVSERGIVWDTSTGPDVDNDNVVSIGSGTGSFSQSVGLLPFGTTIYVRAYATNSEGTAYGTEDSFTTTSTVSVNLTGAEGWRLLSVPDDVSLATFLGPIWTQGATLGGDTDAGTPNVYTWNTSTDGNDPADWQAVTDLTNTTLSGGHGVLVQVYADDDYNDGTTNEFPQQLSVTGSEYGSGVSPAMNSNATGWTVLGNPFASAVTYSDLSPTSLTSTVYTWDPNDDGGSGGQAGQDTGSWKTWNGDVGDVTGGRIAPFQGFLVQNSTTVSSVSFTQSSKTSTSTTFLGKENSIPFVRLELEGRGMKNSAWLEFTSDGSFENTDGDAWELQPLSTNYALLATRKADGSLVDIGRYPQAGELEIPLVTEATQSGRYTITVSDATASGLYLNDLQAGESIPIETGMSYEFSINQAAKVPADPFAFLKTGLKKKAGNEHRFVISSSALENQENETPDRFVLEQNYPNPFNPATVIRYQLPVSSQVRLEVFDMAGRQVATLVNGQKEAGSHTVNFDGSNLSSGVYMYRLRTEGRLFSKKLTLIK